MVKEHVLLYFWQNYTQVHLNNFGDWLLRPNFFEEFEHHVGVISTVKGQGILFWIPRRHPVYDDHNTYMHLAWYAAR